MMNQSMLNPDGGKNMANFFLNPVVRKVSTIDERDGTQATYSGITKKTTFFLAMVLAGAVLSAIVHSIPFGGITDDGGIFVSYLVIGMVIISLACIVICPFLAVIFKKTTPVTGSLSCIGNGCLLASIGIFFPKYRGAMLLAFILTMALVAVMLFVYFSGKIKITKKFRVVVSTLFGTAVLGSLFTGLCYFIPGCRDIYSFIQGNPILSILGSLGGIVIATFFLLMDFDTIHSTVENKLPKKYEWVASFSLAFTVIWLYFKILDLIVTAQKNQNK